MFVTLTSAFYLFLFWQELFACLQLPVLTAVFAQHCQGTLACFEAQCCSLRADQQQLVRDVEKLHTQAGRLCAPAAPHAAKAHSQHISELLDYVAALRTAWYAMSWRCPPRPCSPAAIGSTGHSKSLPLHLTSVHWHGVQGDAQRRSSDKVCNTWRSHL